MKRRKKKRLISLVLICFGIIICGILVCLIFNQRKTVLKIKPILTKEIASSKIEKPDFEEVHSKVLGKNPIDFKMWQGKNKDIYAFIDIEGTPVSYPILRSNEKEEDYYLETTVENIRQLPGAIYTQMINHPDFTDFITVIYGHDMLDGTYFGCLRDYTDRQYFEKNHKIMIYLPKEKLEYHIIGEAVIDDRLIPAHYEVKTLEGRDKFFEYAKETQEEENQWIEDIKLKKDDKLLVLSTCIGSRPDYRRVIIGKLVKREGLLPMEKGRDS